MYLYGLLSAVLLQAKVCKRGLGLQPRLYASSVCNDSAAQAAYAAIVALYEWTLFLRTGCF